MAVPYTVDSKFGGAARQLLFKWKGSIFKLVWPDLLIFLFLYGSISLLYRFGLNPEQQRLFEKICIYCEKYGTLIPVSFVLGFYVSLVIGRWWAQYKVLPWPDTVAIWVNTCIRGGHEDDRILRRTICRYVCLCITHCYTMISIKTKKRFPTMDHLIAAGLLMEHEKGHIEAVKLSIPKYQRQWIPLVWASTLVAQARIDGKINSDTWMKTILDEINKVKDACNLLLCFDRIKVPLVYTQVVTFAVYSYFFSCLMGRQWVSHVIDQDSPKPKTSGKYGVEELDLIFPVFTILQFLFYIGWLKVAESLVNPFGDDDYDFELNWMVDRNLQVSYTIVDRMHMSQNLPSMEKDVYWDEVVPAELPHTLASFKCNNAPPETSTEKVIVSNEEGEIVSSDKLLKMDMIAKTDIMWKRRRGNRNKLIACAGSPVKSEEEIGSENERMRKEEVGTQEV